VAVAVDAVSKSWSMKKLMVAVLGGKGDEKRILKKVEISEIGR
jgi:hypothetical protein